MKTKNFLLKEAVFPIKNGGSIAIGGTALRRHPMAALHEIIRQKKRDLVLFGTINAVDIDLLIAAGCVKEIYSSAVQFDNEISVYALEKAFSEGNIIFNQQPKKIITEQFRAGASSIDFIPLRKSEIMEGNKYIQKLVSPFNGEEYIALKSFQPDVAIIHAHKADQYGNVQFDANRSLEDDIDIFIAESAKHTIVTVEQIVSEAAIEDDPANTVLPASLVDAVVEIPYGAHPFSCDERYEKDSSHLEYYKKISKEPAELNKYIQDYILGSSSWYDYLNKIGMARLLSLSSRQEVSGNA
ncbi:CoA transferase subunit A [Salibacterium aidingense]|uniref:CoA transferase subunit A n=1 Tax=Salibacterium aidingense TaxID=384933 RepID=UPI003BBCCAE4